MFLPILRLGGRHAASGSYGCSCRWHGWPHCEPTGRFRLYAAASIHAGLAVIPALIFPAVPSRLHLGEILDPVCCGLWLGRILGGCRPADIWRGCLAAGPFALARSLVGMDLLLCGDLGFRTGLQRRADRRLRQPPFHLRSSSTAMMLSWLIGGIASSPIPLSAAGPVFAHLADPDLAARFQPLRGELVRDLAKDDLVLLRSVTWSWDEARKSR